MLRCHRRVVLVKYMTETEALKRILSKRQGDFESVNTFTMSPPMNNPTEVGCTLHSVFESSKILEDNARQQFQEALQMLPVNMKTAFLEAMQNHPEVVAREAIPDLFIRHACYNVWTAAKRYVGYWEERKRIFGDRFALPLDMSGNGALTTDDIGAIKLGVAIVLPNDVNGSPVVRWDRSKASSYACFDLQARSRVVFFMLHELSKLEGSLVGGVLVIVRLSNPNPARFFQVSGCKYALDQIAGIFPIKLKNVVGFFPPTSVDNLKIMEYLVQPILSAMNSAYRFVTVGTGSSLDYAAELVNLGLLRNGIPTDMGGEWTYDDDFQQWLNDRGMARSARRQKGSNMVSGEQAAVDNLFHFAKCLAKDKEKEQRRKEKGVIYSKRKRLRQKLRFQKLQSKVSRREGQHAKLRKENLRLQTLLAAANDAIAWYEGKGTSPPESMVPSLPPLSPYHDSEESEEEDVDENEVVNETIGLTQSPERQDSHEAEENEARRSCLAQHQGEYAHSLCDMFSAQRSESFPCLAGQHAESIALPSRPLEGMDPLLVSAFVGQGIPSHVAQLQPLSLGIADQLIQQAVLKEQITRVLQQDPISHLIRQTNGDAVTPTYLNGVDLVSLLRHRNVGDS